MIGKRNIYLVGPMGSGKTAVGKHLARVLGLRFIDTDAEIERRAGVDIPYIFEQEGETGFRRRETEALAELVIEEPVVLATGGGAVIAPANRQLLATHGTVVYLETSVAQQLQRVGTGRGRPLLKDGNLPERLRRLREEREPLYREVADHVIHTDHRRVGKVAEQILREVRGDHREVPEEFPAGP
ncbi:MAG: shikimate kinase [Pseudomonadota bacterium]